MTDKPTPLWDDERIYIEQDKRTKLTVLHEDRWKGAMLESDMMEICLEIIDEYELERAVALERIAELEKANGTTQHILASLSPWGDDND